MGEEGEKRKGREESRRLFLEELRRSGMFKAAARAGGVSGTTIRRWMRLDPRFREQGEQAWQEFLATHEGTEEARALKRQRENGRRAYLKSLEPGQLTMREKARVGHRRGFLEGVRRLGTVSAGAREAGVSRRTAKRWIDEDPHFREEYEEALAEFRDSIEERLIASIDKGDDGATLRFKAKGELPEKYGPRPRQATPEAERGPNWEEMERAEEEQGEE